MRSLIVAGRVIRQIIKDRRTLALLFIAPLLVIFLLYMVLTGGTVRPRIQILTLPSELQTAIAKEADVSEASDLSAALEDLKYRKTDAVVIYSDPTVTVYVEGTQSSITASVKKALVPAISEYSRAHAEETAQEQVQNQMGAIQSGQTSGTVGGTPALTFTLSPTDIQYTYLHGSDDMTSFDVIAPLMMGFFIFFFVFLLAGVAFLRERVSGTLERLLASPVRRYEIVLGYFLGFGVFVLVQTLIIQVYMVDVLHVSLKGDFLLVLLVNLLLAAGSLALGTLLSAFARNELQMFQFIPLVIVPQILFCGLFSLRGAPAWVTLLSKIFPLTYAADALEDVALRGFGLQTILPDLLILSGYMFLFLILNALVLKKYRKI
ncbi:MAG: ABC transporter permease [Clostridiaceae bacterium]|nr:ABC transporter permease [Clostridiaceae bacterium]